MIPGIDATTLADAYMTPQYFWPYAMALMAMVVFAVLGLKAGQPLLWAFGGVVGGLSIATIASGLANASAVPYTDSIRTRNQFIAFAVFVVVFVLVGALLALASNSRPVQETEVARSPAAGQK
jgi:hypothetical protein